MNADEIASRCASLSLETDSMEPRIVLETPLKEAGELPEYKFGTWMRAESPPKVRYSRTVNETSSGARKQNQGSIVPRSPGHEDTRGVPDPLEPPHVRGVPDPLERPHATSTAPMQPPPLILGSGSIYPIHNPHDPNSNKMTALHGAGSLRAAVGATKNSDLHGAGSLRAAVGVTKNSDLHGLALVTSLGLGKAYDVGMVVGVKGVVQREETEAGFLGEGDAKESLGFDATGLVDQSEVAAAHVPCVELAAAHVLGGLPHGNSGHVLARDQAGHVGASLVHPCMVLLDGQGSAAHVLPKVAAFNDYTHADYVTPCLGLEHDLVLPCLGFEHGLPVHCEGEPEATVAANFIFAAHVGAAMTGVLPPSTAAMEVDRKHFKWKRVARRGMVGSGDELQMPCLGKRVVSEPLEGGGRVAPVRLGGVCDNIGRCSASLGRWNSLNRASLRRGINTKRLELASLNRSVSAGSWRDIRLVEKELDDLLLQKEIYWRQRSRVSWLKFGARNSKFFHAKASARRKFNEILGLSDERGCWHSDLGSIHRIVGEYFSSIFSSSALSLETLRRVTQVVEPRVSSTMNELLDAKFSAEEVRQALILWGRALIEKGSRWRVGSGSSVSILQDRWLPCPSSFKIIASCSIAGDAMVASLKSASGAWDSVLVRSSFAPIDADCILNLPTSVRSCPDKLMWHHSKDGKYSVKSGYWLASSLARDGTSSSSSSAGSSWVPVGAGYPLCDAAVESVLYSLWLCRSLAKSKAAVPFLASLRLPAEGSFLDFILACFSILLVHEMELLLVLLWQFWFRRNRAVHSAPLLSVEDTVGWSERFLVDFQAAVAVPSVRCDLIVERLGFGVVIRVCTGKVLVSYTSLLLGLFSSDIGEALAILLGLRLAIDMGLSTVCVESDAASVVKQLSSRVTSCSDIGLILDDIGLILDDILSLVVNFADLSFSSVRRSTNIVAHGLAKFALSHQPVGVRLGSVPNSLALVVLDDSRDCP
ncbi:hypothetical protein JRO89_XS04G0226300 [Xanthoceras sorbifolium]|uniref:RNase H type-1 domain-containing protein n=1 Tax=Xanthoceras sorbifolium TaxID=99658 RepID=A0ABQ8I6S0_9ROSI|nr:hypothetical protein JRO89_XS04G0226300 [Xanthoceras sorbifolium]